MITKTYLTATYTANASPELRDAMYAIHIHPNRALVRIEQLWLACCVGIPNKQGKDGKLPTAMRVLAVLDSLPAPSTWTPED